MLTESAWAKINLYLHVTGRRADGYHLLDSLVVFAGAADRLSASNGESLSLELTGPFGAVLTAEADNLVLRAARALRASGGARLLLDKQLPVASGIGGGSADAAAALRLLARMWGVAPATAETALSLGADVPACLASTPCRMRGVGEVLSPAPQMPRFFMVLVNPGVAVATPAVFRAREGAFSLPANLPTAWPSAASMAADLDELGNDLEAPAMAICPPIAEVLTALRSTQGCLLARMSGSGATCFGLYESLDRAHGAATACARTGWWSWGGEARPS